MNWDSEIIFETHGSGSYDLWRIAFRPNDPAIPQPQPEPIKGLGEGGTMQINPSAGVVAYAATRGDGLHLLDLNTGQDRLVAPNVFKFALDTAGPFASLAYLREAPAGGYELALYSPNSGTETVLDKGTTAITAQLNFVRQGGYLVMQVSAPTDYALVFTAGFSPALLANIDLEDAVIAVETFHTRLVAP